MRNSFSASLLLSAALALAAAVALILGVQAAVVRTQSGWFTRHGLEGSAQDLAKAIRFDPQGKPVRMELTPTMKHMVDALPFDLMYRVLDSEGRVLMGSGGAQPLTPEGLAFDGSRSFFDFGEGETKMHAATLPVQNAGKRAYVQVAKSERFEATMQRNNYARERETAIVAALLAIVVFGAAVLFHVGWLLRRLRKAADAAARIEPTNITARLDATDVPSEIRPLINSFNLVLGRLEHGYRVQQEFLATAAHELKTPLTLIRGQVELDDSRDNTAILRDIDHMARQVHQLLHLAEVSELQNYSLNEIDVADAVQAVIEHLSRLAEPREVQLQLDSPAARVCVRADAGAFNLLLRNLIENAIHHSPAGGRVAIRVGPDGVHIRDRGNGIDPADLPRLFQRFWRGAHRRDDGAGLGLAICREIANFHDWTLTARNAAPGAEFSLRFGAIR